MFHTARERLSLLCACMQAVTERAMQSASAQWNVYPVGLQVHLLAGNPVPFEITKTTRLCYAWA